jgi:hypothetical protein
VFLLMGYASKTRNPLDFAVHHNGRPCMFGRLPVVSLKEDARTEG